MTEASCVIDPNGLELLIQHLRQAGYTVVGPTLADDAIIYDEISSSSDLPAGWSDEQGPGHYRLQRRNDRALFAYNVGPHAWKKFLFPSRQRLWQLQKTDNGFQHIKTDETVPRYAFLGVRACELKAIGIQDTVFLKQEHTDPIYQERRKDNLIIAVNCTRAGGTCFCASMNAGPRAQDGYDLVLTEQIDGDRHEFLVETGSDSGAAVLNTIYFDSEARAATDKDHTDAAQQIQSCAEHMGRSLDNQNAPAALADNPEHPRWQAVADRCLSCANCTMVCPTCFCSNVTDTSDLSGDIAERWRTWGSCFESDFSAIHGNPIRSTTSSRYRQWITHKLSSWHDQFDSSGCVGCGRCITWCPVGIDITEEAAAIITDNQNSDTGKLP